MNAHTKLFVLLQILLFSFVGRSLPVLAEQGHKAPHNGCLSVIEGCGLGHVELNVDGEKLELWFLDGGDHTDRSVALPEGAFPLTLISSDGRRLESVAVAAPLVLAGEKAGTCSHFTATVPGLSGLRTFEAYAWVRFKGAMRPVKITYPDGFDPDHDDKHDGDHEDDHHGHQHK